MRNLSALLPILFTTLSVACVVHNNDDGDPLATGNEVGAIGPVDQDFGGCSRGHCVQTCAAGQSCAGSCSGGGCTQTCSAEATCHFNCSGGGCTQTCAAGASCDDTCTGGGCRR